MAENIEFISAANLPEAEGDEVSVVCLENGELKQKPGASLGGSKWDGVVTCSGIPCYFRTGWITLTDFDFTAIKEKILAGNEVVIMLHCVYNYGDDYEVWAKSSSVYYNSTSDTIAVCWPTAYSTGNTIIEAVNASMIVASDGTVVAAGYNTV